MEEKKPILVCGCNVCVAYRNSAQKSAFEKKHAAEIASLVKINKELSEAVPKEVARKIFEEVENWWDSQIGLEFEGIEREKLWLKLQKLKQKWCG